MTEYETRTTRVTVAPKGEPIFSERSTHVFIEDLAGGEFVRVEQMHGEGRADSISIDPEEWAMLLLAINNMVKECRSDDN